MKTKEELLKLREDIIEVSLELLKQGLIVRTWGNISARIDDDHYIITPSGIKYEDLEPSMLPVVNIADGSFEGDFKPSSEYLVHSAVYKARKDAEFVIHTHQTYATVVGALGKKRLKAEKKDQKIIFPVAKYALPGTEKLANNVLEAIGQCTDVKSVIMANHGSVSFGRTAEDAVKEAFTLEKAAKGFVFNVCKTDIEFGIDEGFSSYLEDGEIKYINPGTPERIKLIHKEIYSKRSDVKYIFHNKSEAVMTISRRVNHMKPLLDDFAQIIGTGVRIPTSDVMGLQIKKNVNVVFGHNDGAYCLGTNEDEARAAAIVLDKGCIAHIAVIRFGEGRFLSYFDCLKMNKNYRNNYSKLAETVNE